MKKNTQKLINKYNEARRIYIESKALRGTKVSDIENIYLKYEIHYSDISNYENSQLEIVTEDDKLKIDSMSKELSSLEKSIKKQHQTMMRYKSKLESEAIWRIEYPEVILNPIILTNVTMSECSTLNINPNKTGLIYAEELDGDIFSNVLSFEGDKIRIQTIKPIAYKLLNLKNQTVINM